jgi:hypothetical protein
VLLLLCVQQRVDGVHAHLKWCERFQLRFDGIQSLQHGRQCRFERRPEPVPECALIAIVSECEPKPRDTRLSRLREEGVLDRGTRHILYLNEVDGGGPGPLRCSGAIAAPTD